MQTGSRRAFLDTTLLIYFLDNDANFGEKSRLILEELIETDIPLVTSVITCT